ncbi:hypothetical protein D3C80_1301250 [compost metagenome]
MPPNTIPQIIPANNDLSTERTISFVDESVTATLIINIKLNSTVDIRNDLDFRKLIIFSPLSVFN